MPKMWYDCSEWIHGIPLTRYIASWYQAGGIEDLHAVREWLRSLTINGEKLDDDEVRVVSDCIVLGKLELEESAKAFV